MAVETPEQLSGLAGAYARLDPKQREAVDARDDTVVLAGPGSGKTDTLAVKGAVLLREIRAPQGIAALTYTNAAAREIADRIAHLGERGGRRFFTGTVHSFCLRGVIKPFAGLAGTPSLADREVIAAGTARSLLRHAADAEGVTSPPSEPRLQWVRRAAACHQDLSGHFDRFEIAVMRRYEKLLVEGGFIDFDGIIHEALGVIAASEAVRDLLAARYPWLLVDEYQDLGGPLHEIVQHLREASVRVMAVGDPDQTILQFTGADARYLGELEETGCRRIDLAFNYRSGRRLIDAAAGALPVDRNYEPHPDSDDEGEVLSLRVQGGLVPQVATLVDDLLPRLTEQDGRPLHEIAILYPGRSWLLDLIVAKLVTEGIPYSLERDARFGHGEVVAWLQRCAQWAVDAPSERVIRFRDLANGLRTYLVDAHHRAGVTSLAAAEFLFPVLERGVAPDTLLLDWLKEILGMLDLREILKAGGIHNQEIEALDELLLGLRGSHAGTTVEEFAGPVRRPGRVVVTTYHSAKGRQFDAVLLPGLQDGIMPRAYRGRIRNVDHDRNLFYVGFTRARHTVVMLWSDSSEDAWGNAAGLGPSRFVGEIEARLP